MDPERRVRLSKFLSLILRHRPDQVGLTLDPLGRLMLERHQTRGQVITIFARRAHDRGVAFYQATDRLYLVSQVPPEFLGVPAPSPVGGRR